MADPIKVDSHVHLYRTPEQALEDKEIYEIFEYGTSADVHWSALTGTIEETLEAMAGADIAAAIVVNLYVAAWERLRFANHLPKDLNDAEREKAMANFEGRIPDELMAFNRWGCQIARDHGQITTLVCADLQIMSADETQAHVRDMVENERSTAINPSETVEEKVSLSDRFGLWLGFHNCSQDEFLDMVRGYAAHYKLKIKAEELERTALEWSMTRGARSGRVAWQFIQDLAGRMGCKL